eukprot:3167177-Rhodomonas_salina.1
MRAVSAYWRGEIKGVSGTTCTEKKEFWLCCRAAKSMAFPGPRLRAFITSVTSAKRLASRGANRPTPSTLDPRP